MTETRSAATECRVRWRAMGDGDLPAIAAIAEAVHPTLPERPEVFAEKLGLYPDGCFVLAGGGGGADGAVLGYAFAHPWQLNAVPKLDAFLSALPADADCLFLHDVAVARQARGQSASGALVARLVELAERHGLTALALAAVYGTGRHWARLGFAPVGNEAVAAQLKCYGAAQYMVRRLG
ncbi:MAG: GNAT family N-acetyltransferase [Methyloceanibacter sp.]